ncbi:uncharacterized protein ALTATR162_LOCUS3710 [Alternaria atra]|uniref:Uncharacterized protein n=1 Tax=Alternaria atra TaxID=119953 RepID=A0A8J2I0M8_9PLEO|nr:uncharacterized protein ALTATR162_LOCUS3710 [Alternaria atra]CAG5155535.1 unnamed protein product [Alternaria atra]
MLSLYRFYHFSTPSKSDMCRQGPGSIPGVGNNHVFLQFAWSRLRHGIEQPRWEFLVDILVGSLRLGDSSIRESQKQKRRVYSQ